MTKLVWDMPAERLYETGLDKGVLYVPNALGVYDNGFAWNGLTSISESFPGDTNKPHYFDGVKYLDSYQTGDFAATLSAFTYPDEFLEFEGISLLGNGLFADDQQSKWFGLSYRTLIGSAIEGLELGYQIHLLYNLTTVEPSATYQNGSELQTITFAWEVNSVPEKTRFYRPTSHIILDSRYLPEDMLKAFEDVLYGTEDENPRLPSLPLLIEIVLGWDPRIIQPDPVGGLAPLVVGVGDLTETKHDGLYSALPTTRLVQTTVDGLYELETV